MKYLQKCMLIPALFILCSISIAQENKETTEAFQGDVEEIIVEGKISKESYTRITEKMEDEFIDRFNELNVDDEFDIKCEYQYSAGSHIKTRICQTEYMKKAYHLAARNSRAGMAGNITGELTSKGRSFWRLYNKILEDDFELQLIADDLNGVKFEYMNSRRDYMNARINKMISRSK